MISSYIKRNPRWTKVEEIRKRAVKVTATTAKGRVSVWGQGESSEQSSGCKLQKGACTTRPHSPFQPRDSKTVNSNKKHNIAPVLEETCQTAQSQLFSQPRSSLLEKSNMVLTFQLWNRKCSRQKHVA